MADRRLYAKLSLDFADSHKIAPLSDAAFRAYVRMLLWSRRMLTDGKIPGPMALVIAGKPKILDELTRNDPSQPSLWLDADGDYWIHDFLEHQPSRAEVEAQQERNRENGRSGGLAKRKRVASESLSETGSQRLANAYTETESETTTGLTEVRPVSETPAAAPDGLSKRAQIFGFDGDRVRREMAKAIGEIPDDDAVMRVATEVLGRAAVPAKNPTAYLVRSIRNDEFGIQKLAYGGAA